MSKKKVITLTFPTVELLVDALHQEIKTVRGYSFVGIEGYTPRAKKAGVRESTRAKEFIRRKHLKNRGQFIIQIGMAIVVNGKRFVYQPEAGAEIIEQVNTGTRANYLINISPNINTALKNKELAFWDKYAENPFQDKIENIKGSEGKILTQSEKERLAVLEPQAEAQRQNQSALILNELIKDGDTEYWNASADAIVSAVAELNHMRKNPNPNRRNGQLNGATFIGDTGLKYFDKTGNYMLFGLKVNRNPLPDINSIVEAQLSAEQRVVEGENVGEILSI